jgi:glycosyltransferase involved in cell wall biosynthesis
MSVRLFISRLKRVHTRDGTLLFIKKLFLYFPKKYLVQRHNLRKAYKNYLQNEYSTQELEILHSSISSSPLKPLLSILIPTYKSNLHYLRLTIASIYKQSYSNWEVCIADDASEDPELNQYLKDLSSKDPRFKCYFSSINQHISKTSNLALELCAGEFVVLLDHDDELSPYALAHIADKIIKHPNLKIIYSDEDKMDLNGYRYEPYFKCNWNYELFLGQNLISHLGAYSLKLVKKVGGFRAGYEGSQDYDLALRCIELVNDEDICHIPKVLYHWRALPGSTARNIDEKPYATIAAEKALKDHLTRIGRPGTAEYFGYGYKITFEIQASDNLINAFVPVASVAQLQQARELAEKLLSMSSIQEVTLLIKKELGRTQISIPNKITIDYISDENFIGEDVNYKIILNHVLNVSKTYALLIAPDAQFGSEKWILDMISEVLKPSVAAVSNASLNQKNELISGPIIINSSGNAITPFYKLSNFHGGYFGRKKLTQQLSALGMDCLLMNTNLIQDAIGNDAQLIGSDEEFFGLIRTKKFKLIWSPLSQIYLSSPSRTYKKFSAGKGLGSQKAVVDEFYSPNLDEDILFIPRRT